jgi:hypothetical protein
VSILSPEDLIAQAAKLIRPPPKGPPLQVDLRRAISAAYYGVFHATLIAVADTLIGRATHCAALSPSLMAFLC